MRGVLALWSALAVAMAQPGPSLKQAAALYHQGRYDSALAVLRTCRTGVLKRRDSLALFQYSGMASARLGRADAAAADFRSLLDLDSLFQFPRNEDSAVLAAFARARAERDGSEDADPQADLDAQPRIADAGGKAALPSNAAATGAAPMSGLAPETGPGPLPAHSGPGPATGPASALATPTPPGRDRQAGIGLALGAIPLGGGWLAQGRRKQGWTLACLQAGGFALSLYASSQMTALKRDADGTRDRTELGAETRWQWTQRVSLSVALGAYLFSLIASKGE